MAPGTSDHGQDRAVDFVIKKNGVVIAGIVQSKWIDTGYRQRGDDCRRDRARDVSTAPDQNEGHW